MTTRVPTVLLALAGLAVFSPSARGDGLPVVGIDAGPEGVLGPSADVRYVTAETRRRTTVVATSPNGGQIVRSAFLDGRFTVPAVAYDGTASGLSADGRTLVLINPRARFPRKRTSFAVLDAKRLRLRDVIRLRGDFSYDALSPDGRSLFLIQYLSRQDPRRYRVRVYDLQAGELAPKPIVDPRESPDEMNGLPMTRATSFDGRWAYTLYEGSSGKPFIHALDTRQRRAVCIDLDHIRMPRTGLGGVKLLAGAGNADLQVTFRRRPLAIVNTSDFRVSEPPAAGDAKGVDRSLWTLIGLAGLAAVALGTAAVARPRRLARAR